MNLVFTDITGIIIIIIFILDIALNILKLVYFLNRFHFVIYIYIYMCVCICLCVFE